MNKCLDVLVPLQNHISCHSLAQRSAIERMLAVFDLAKISIEHSKVIELSSYVTAPLTQHQKRQPKPKDPTDEHLPSDCG